MQHLQLVGGLVLGDVLAVGVLDGRRRGGVLDEVLEARVPVGAGLEGFREVGAGDVAGEVVEDTPKVTDL